MGQQRLFHLQMQLPLDADGILLPSSDADANAAAGRRTRRYYGHGYLTIVTKLNRRE